MCYKKVFALINQVKRLVGLPYLNKVLVVWNSDEPWRAPPPDARWPDIGVRLQVIRTKRNSMNNRFLPWDVIETDAIFLVDDDIIVTQEEIVYGFRVWRENRDRIVGIVHRYHAWDPNERIWKYHPRPSCEMSMVLIGCSFFHKYYTYMYSQVMPQSVRNMVDKMMNCDDLAMNVLVSHITRKPPIKIGKRVEILCDDCAGALSHRKHHLDQRHDCLNYFNKVWGYMPLIYSQMRGNSMYYNSKTLYPMFDWDKDKCFYSI